MKTFTFRLDPKASIEGMANELKQTVAQGVPQLHPDELSSNSVSALLSMMTPGRIELFYMIASTRSDSIYQLAQLLKRDTANVLRDAKALEALGLITLVTEKNGGRERSRPVAKYERILFDFGKARQANVA